MKTIKILLLFSFILGANRLYAQLDSQQSNLACITFINPGFSLELPYAGKKSLSIHAGIGYSGAYPNLSYGGAGVAVLISPFIDIQNRMYLKRQQMKYRKGGFIMARALLRPGEIYSNFSREGGKTDIALGIGFGVQNYKRRLGYSFSIAPYYYSNMKGKDGFFPIIPELNIGYRISK